MLTRSCHGSKRRFEISRVLLRKDRLPRFRLPLMADAAKDEFSDVIQRLVESVAAISDRLPFDIDRQVPVPFLIKSWFRWIVMVIFDPELSGVGLSIWWWILYEDCSFYNVYVGFVCVCEELGCWLLIITSSKNKRNKEKQNNQRKKERKRGISYMFIL